MQRKLTEFELRHITAARVELGKISCFYSEFKKLCDAIEHGTTGGKPYVEPEPPIPDGFRKAVAGDEGRLDCKVWKGGGYVDRWESKHLTGESPFVEGNHYIVPVDRVPNDDDAKKRPTVMVRDSENRPWKKRDLLAVFKGRDMPFLALTECGTCATEWKYCRHLYDGE